MKKLKVKLVRLLTYDNKKETKQENQWLNATITLDDSVDLGDFIACDGMPSGVDLRYNVTSTPWYIQTVTPLDLGGQKRERKRNVKTIREINEAEKRVTVPETPDTEDNTDNAGSGEGTEQSLPDSRTDAKC